MTTKTKKNASLKAKAQAAKASKAKETVDPKAANLEALRAKLKAKRAKQAESESVSMESVSDEAAKKKDEPKKEKAIKPLASKSLKSKEPEKKKKKAEASTKDIEKAATEEMKKAKFAVPTGLKFSEEVQLLFRKSGIRLAHSEAEGFVARFGRETDADLEIVYEDKREMQNLLDGFAVALARIVKRANEDTQEYASKHLTSVHALEVTQQS